MCLLPSAQIKLIYRVKSKNLARKLADQKNVAIIIKERGQLTFEKKL
jgi:hypothetical protein